MGLVVSEVQSCLSTMIVIGRKMDFSIAVLILVLSAIVPSLQDIGSNTHPDLPICGHVSPFFLALVVLGGETWGVGRVQAGICPEFEGGDIEVEFGISYIDFEQSHHSNFYF